MPEAQRETPEIKEMAGYGCGTFMHIVQLKAPGRDNEGLTFSRNQTSTSQASSPQANAHVLWGLDPALT